MKLYYEFVIAKRNTCGTVMVKLNSTQRCTKVFKRYHTQQYFFIPVIQSVGTFSFSFTICHSFIINHLSNMLKTSLYSYVKHVNFSLVSKWKGFLFLSPWLFLSVIWRFSIIRQLSNIKYLVATFILSLSLWLYDWMSTKSIAHLHTMW